LKILHFVVGRCNPDSSNGVDKTIYYLSKAQAELGEKVFIYSITNKDVITISGVNVSNYKPEKMPFPLPSKLKTDIISLNPDIVHFHSGFIPLNVILAKFLNKKNIPYVVTPNGVFSPALLRRKPYIKVPFRYLFELPYLKKAKFIHAVSENEMKEFNYYKIKTEMILAPNGIDMSSIPNSFDNKRLSRDFPEIKGKRIFLFLGRLDIEQKGLDLLLLTIAKIKSELTNSIFVLVGPEWNNSGKILMKMIHELKIENYFVLTGPAHDQKKFDYLSAADVFLHISRWEGLPFAILEALACGKPCIVTNKTNIANFINKYNAGEEVSHYTNGIAGCILEFSRMSDMSLSQYSKNALKLAHLEFDWKKIAKTITNNY